MRILLAMLLLVVCGCTIKVESTKPSPPAVNYQQQQQQYRQEQERLQAARQRRYARQQEEAAEIEEAMCRARAASRALQDHLTSELNLPPDATDADIRRALLEAPYRQ